jgi:hypothetical protein
MMSVKYKHARHQIPVVAALVQALARSKQGKSDLPPIPGPELSQTIPPRPDALINDYLRHVGGDLSTYKGIVPWHFFPQFAFPLMTKALEAMPYPLTRLMNGGCTCYIKEQLARGKPLEVKTRLSEVDADERRIILTQRISIGTEKTPEAVLVDHVSIIPLGGGGGDKKAKKEKPRVPDAVREIGRFRVGAKAGLEFAFLTGDINPLHWVGPYARSLGHRGPIVHGFNTMAHAIEVLNKNLWAKDVTQLKSFSIRFTRPMLMPGGAGVYLDAENNLYVGDGPEGPAYALGWVNK